MPDRRKPIRLKGFDYAAGNVYFITICLHNRLPLFGEITSGEVRLNPAGQMIERIWLGMQDHMPGVVLDCHVVMPNHFHAVLGLINRPTGREQCPAPTDGPDGSSSSHSETTLQDIVRNFKSLTTIEYGRGVKELGWKPYVSHLWQRSYYDHIIRDDRDLEHHREYVFNNPHKWELDELYPGN